MIDKSIINVLTYLNSRGERGAVAAEYGVLLALIAVALVAIIAGLTGGITAAFQRAINVLNGGA